MAEDKAKKVPLVTLKVSPQLRRAIEVESTRIEVPMYKLADTLWELYLASNYETLRSQNSREILKPNALNVTKKSVDEIGDSMIENIHSRLGSIADLAGQILQIARDEPGGSNSQNASVTLVHDDSEGEGAEKRQEIRDRYLGNSVPIKPATHPIRTGEKRTRKHGRKPA